MVALSSEGCTEGFRAAPCRDPVDAGRTFAPSLFPDQQKFVDQHVRAFYRRLCHAAAGAVLLDRGFTRGKEVDVAFSGFWNERDPGLCACGHRVGDERRL